MIVFCENYAFVGSTAQAVTFRWREFDTVAREADFVFQVVSHETGTVRFTLESSTDGDISTTLANEDLNAEGRSSVTLATTLLPLVRLTLRAQAGAARVVVSAYLLPKHE